MIRITSALLAIVALALALGACGGGGNGGDEGDTGAQAGPPPAPAPEEGARPETPLVASFGETFAVQEGQSIDGGEPPFPPESVEAHWYASGGRYVAVYVGVPADAGSGCVGNLLTAGGSDEVVSNGPTESGACPDWLPPDLVASEDVQTCGDALVLVSEIPVGETGELGAGIGRVEEDTITGISGTVSTDAGEAPDVDLAELGC